MLSLYKAKYHSVEVYGRQRYMDIHNEKYSTTQTSLPNGSEYYNGLKIYNIEMDSSLKLIIGSHVMSALVTSSLRLDLEIVEPELGPSTYNFKTSNETRLFIPSPSLEKAERLYAAKSMKLNNYDLYAQLKQIRSKFTIPTSYRLSRCCSKFTDTIFLRPYTVFTAATKEDGDENCDLKIGSRISRLVAKQAIEGKRGIKRSELVNLAS